MKKLLIAGNCIFLCCAILLAALLYASETRQRPVKAAMVAETAQTPLAAAPEVTKAPVSELPSTKIQTEEDLRYMDIFNPGYKMFYGEWEVTRLLVRNVHIDTPEDLVGRTVYYDYTAMKNDGIDIPGTVIYMVEIYPQPGHSHFYYTASPQDMGIGGDYFVDVTVEPQFLHNEINGKRIIGDSFLIKDDQTLILSYDNCFYEMKRKSYIEGHDEYYFP